MEHLAILSKKSRLLRKILSGEKKIESRWYKFKRPPFGRVSMEDSIYFKESGEPVSVKAKVKDVIIYENLNIELINEIIEKWGNSIGVNSSFVQEVKDKRFCILIFLDNVQKIEPFEINKKGYGLMNAWISIEDINKLKK